MTPPSDVEIERKFLVAGAVPEGPETAVRQGYLAVAADRSEVRVRERNGAFTLTVKQGTGLVRQERDTPISEDLFAALWPLTEGRRVVKRRREVHVGAQLVEVDTYADELAGLVVAEVEFRSESAAAAFAAPEWFGTEVTGRAEYANQALAQHGLPDRG